MEEGEDEERFGQGDLLMFSDNYNDVKISNFNKFKYCSCGYTEGKVW